MRKLQITIITVLALIFLGTVVVISPWYGNWQMKNIAFEWCGLAPIKVMETNSFEITGSMFTRGCEWEFSVPPEKINEWIQKSPGLSRPREVKVYTDKHKIYIVTPGGGACYGEVDIRFDTGEIILKTYWS